MGILNIFGEDCWELLLPSARDRQLSFLAAGKFPKVENCQRFILQFVLKTKPEPLATIFYA